MEDKNMIDAENTTVEWQKHKTDILVLPVGAMEQHGPALPLNTDQVIAEYVARIVAEHFNAALLPCIAVANSLEHTGFRGTFSLRPETLMRVIRDIADEAESQGFRFMLLINAHGGNFVLGPVCRDINRSDRRIKLILHQAFNFADPSQLETVNKGMMDMHAGESETSILMAVEGKKRKTCKSAGNESLFRQDDLNTFGIAHLNRNGVPGHPELASLEKGIHLCETMKKPMIEDLEKRISYLRKHNAYAGQAVCEIVKT
jgi:creatinine amidohydrolase